LFNIKAFVDGKPVPVKVLGGRRQESNRAGRHGLGHQSALMPDGSKLDVKGMTRAGSIINIKAIDPATSFSA
jgi:hypothetical protein